jgi:glucose-1-phosphate cytidylyltransferase
MDTIKEKNYLDDLWVNGKAPWRIWDAESKDGSNDSTVEELYA